MRITKDIEEFIKNMLVQGDGELEIKRNELASQFNCVPSQINYVISTRFTNECGYLVESRRGGGGYIKITKVNVGKGNYLMHTINSIGDMISWQTTVAIVGNCVDYGAITHREAKIILAVLSDNSLGVIERPHRDILRAKLLKNMLVNSVD
ncbi:MAG: CtsR family transcriptional regulator [Eubacteriales bacterium]|nr:CtsR family transcriptional regulator [Eubacteriales bacterium]